MNMKVVAPEDLKVFRLSAPGGNVLIATGTLVPKGNEVALSELSRLKLNGNWRDFYLLDLQGERRFVLAEKLGSQ